MASSTPRTNTGLTGVTRKRLRIFSSRRPDMACGCQWRVSVYLDRWRVQPVLLSFVMNELMGDNAHKGNSHRSPLPFSKCLSQPPVHGKFTNRLLPPYWKRWSLYGRHIMRIEYLSDKLWLEVTPCIVPMIPGSDSRFGGIGAAPDYGEVVSKSFLLAHRPDWWLVGLCAFSFWKLLIGLMNWKERLYISLWRHNFAPIAENH